MAGFEFRRLTRADFPLLCGWLAQPHIQRWWADDPSPQAVEADYGDSIDGKEPAQVFTAWHRGKPLGLAQRYQFAAYPQYAKDLEGLVEVARGACSIDYFIGAPEDTGQGLGSAMLRAFTVRLWLDDPEATMLIVPVHAHNIASWRALEKIGFARAASGPLEPDNSADSRDHYIYCIARPGASAPR